ncbi:ribonuclease H-like domain-containing protein [Haloterrigena sp. SYSU A558-1]|uniref:Ribonuclease H-like domain-containing protein n=1 Tax=Haloterrigena gelatinilytica TaxID=2741724 RepID=A0ABX2LHZ9_9EURY|nr:ribonuclease H-like domain-containing protein [Haloterrigena gelatinilytica]NUC75013.1 ribonuclease H-like domain-containing protein [Haloterrigena gelatinilytica]
MQYDRDDAGYDRLATFDIETTHYKASEGETVSVGVAIHDRATDELTYEPFHRESADDEAEIITDALAFVESCGADAVVSYNGIEFDLDFLTDRLYRLGADNAVADADLEPHIDVFADRKAVCDRTGKKWPKLEECLASYDYPEPVTEWGGAPVTNTRFGEELGPTYLEAVADGGDRADELLEVIDHYLVTDLEANLAIYHADCGVDFAPEWLGDRKEF